MSTLVVCDLIYCVASLMLYLLFWALTLLSSVILLYDGWIICFSLILGVLCVSILVSNVISVVWYLFPKDDIIRSLSDHKDLGGVICIHLFQLGIVWRYMKLIFLRDSPHNKDGIRKLLTCEVVILRVFHSAASTVVSSSLLLFATFSDQDGPNYILLLSAFSGITELAWTMAAVSRKTERNNFSSFILSWPGIAAQFCWRFGTISSRIFALAAYASIYTRWTFVVLLLHFLLMFCGICLVFPLEDNNDRPPRRNAVRTIPETFLLALICTFVYFNPEPRRSTLRATVYYGIILFENSLLTALWKYQTDSVGLSLWYSKLVPVLVWGGLLLGLCFMAIYYQCFHISGFITTGQSLTGNQQGLFHCQMPFRMPTLPTKKPSKFSHHLSPVASQPPLEAYRSAETAQMSRKQLGLGLEAADPCSSGHKGSDESVIETSF